MKSEREPRKFLCIGGPHDGKWMPEEGLRETYVQYNRSYRDDYNRKTTAVLIYKYLVELGQK